MVVGLENTGDPRAQAIAFDLASRWINNNFAAYQQSSPNAMFEKVLYSKLLHIDFKYLFHFHLLFSMT